MKTENSLQADREMLWPLHAISDEQSLSREEVWETILNEALDRLCSDESVFLKEFIDELEKKLIFRTLFRANGNRKQAAEFLGIKYTTLHEKLKKHNIRFKSIAF